MGGDFAPKATIAGALLALQELDGAHTVQLVGQTSVIESQIQTLLAGEYSAAASARPRIEIVEAPDVIEMSEKPTAGLRKKPKSSMIVGLRLQTEGKSDAFVSAGNTGAQMASSAMLLKLQPGLTRPVEMHLAEHGGRITGCFQLLRQCRFTRIERGTKNRYSRRMRQLTGKERLP